jgi:hypothetical protein
MSSMDRDLVIAYLGDREGVGKGMRGLPSMAS